MNLYTISYSYSGLGDKQWAKSRAYNVSAPSIMEGVCRVFGTGLNTPLSAELWTSDSGKEAEEEIYKKLVEALIKTLDRSISTREAYIEALKSERTELIETFGNEESE